MELKLEAPVESSVLALNDDKGTMSTTRVKFDGRQLDEVIINGMKIINGMNRKIEKGEKSKTSLSTRSSAFQEQASICHTETI